MMSTTTHAPTPLQGATPVQAVVRFFQRYATFRGRASRSEYWWWVLANTVIALGINGLGILTVDEWHSAPLDVLSPFASGPGGPVTSVAGGLFLLYAVGTLVPALALTWRRLHDIDRSGAWFFVSLIPLVGAIILLIFMALPSNPDGARFDGITAEPTVSRP